MPPTGITFKGPILNQRFLLPLHQCEFQLTNAIEQLQKDPWPVANDRRPLRCTGVALSVAVGILEVQKQDLFLISRAPSLILGPVLCFSLVAQAQRAQVW